MTQKLVEPLLVRLSMSYDMSIQPNANLTRRTLAKHRRKKVMPTTITYIEHSCFLIETDACYLLFDYFAGEQALPTLDMEKPLILFNSHAHHDHFSEKIFDLRTRYPKCFFVLSEDIPVPETLRSASHVPTFSVNHQGADAQRSNSDKQAVCFMAAHTTRVLKISENGNVSTPTVLAVSTLRSNDEGVAFLVELEGLRFYHAGDLNNWWWDGDAEDIKLAKQYHEELARIRGQHFDAAFIPLDPRLKGWWKGIEDFMHYADADALFPMHNFGKKGLPKKLLALDCVTSYRDRIRDVEEPGTCFFL